TTRWRCARSDRRWRTPRCGPSCSPTSHAPPADGPTSCRWAGFRTRRSWTRRWSRWAGARTLHSGTAGGGSSRWRCCSGRSGSSAGASATSDLVRFLLEPARLGGQPVRAVNSPAAPAPGLGDPAAAEGPQAELPEGVSHALAPGAAAPARVVGGLTGPAAVLHHQGQGLGEADLPARIDVDRRAGAGPGADEVHAAEQRLLFEERSGTAGAFHEGHTTPGG